MIAPIVGVVAKEVAGEVAKPIAGTLIKGALGAVGIYIAWGIGGDLASAASTKLREWQHDMENTRRGN